MKQFFTFLTMLAVVGWASAQDDTFMMQHIAPENATEMPGYWGQTSQQGVPLWGYYIGHNAWGDEEFGEKYEVDHADVVGIIAYFGGQATSNGTASLNLYEVGSNGLPSTLEAGKSFTYSEVATDGVTPTMITFDDHVHVHDEFFVTLNLGDYSHDPLQGDTIVLMMGPDGSRPASDDVFGRNVIRWHSHSGTPQWKDFLTQNFTPVSTYFAIYPVAEGEPLSIDNGFLAGDGIDLFPIPCASVLNLRFNALETRDVNVHLFDITGKLLQGKRFVATSGENLIQLNMDEYASGSYVVAVDAGGFRYSKVISK